MKRCPQCQRQIRTICRFCELQAMADDEERKAFRERSPYMAQLHQDEADRLREAAHEPEQSLLKRLLGIWW